MVRKVIFDTDPGIDDAIATAILLNSDQVQVELITAVGGNVALEKTSTNALKLVNFFEKDIPVAAGNHGPLLTEFTDASEVHGESGMDGYDFPDPDKSQLLEEHAVLAMRKVLMESDEKVTIVAVGPQTNVALLLTMYPEVKDKIEEIIIMGGSFTRGNKHVMDEFNIGTDPEAAQMVLQSSVKTVMVGLDIGYIATIGLEEAAELAEKTETGKMIHSMLQHYRSAQTNQEWEMYDPTAIAYLLEPEMFEEVECNVEVELGSPLTYGQTVVDLDHKTDRPVNCVVPTTIDRNRFKEWFKESILKCK
ncbi:MULTISPECIES: ribonucleoside hydrolase RihC [Aerococcus]|uniref:ribonucleoside hydrolase RihC n=1 Tax=Aerococcus TaxID=1375 RepID=UPI000DCD6C65|nr:MULTISPECIES: ribonucleoside hydrolase RihC [Aerococcus]KAA9297528.1 ribonucleoside hydrolase RihC [Aerococcus tenax]MDK6688192.1 ribonucleoside hydrolase RihC [Aerococcus urinae]MDK8132688.1 ribonucleoside hydrolase RihC [Aerococcus urinae]MDK8484391.1 ribonucleoside hydrolase RihC [Aerococcus urinae]MDL5179326.1 ribonucleoside hydrolase RihC [Aerococcus tenax]